jgi:hypothetical protein
LHHVILDNRTPELASTLGRYASAVVLVGGAAILKVVFFPALERHLPFTFFYSAIVATSWVAGTAPGLLATGLSAACVYYLFSGSTAETSPGNPGLLLFALEATGICLLTGTFRQRLVETEAHLGRVSARHTDYRRRSANSESEPSFPTDPACGQGTVGSNDQSYSGIHGKNDSAS